MPKFVPALFRRSYMSWKSLHLQSIYEPLNVLQGWRVYGCSDIIDSSTQSRSDPPPSRPTQASKSRAYITSQKEQISVNTTQLRMRRYARKQQHSNPNITRLLFRASPPLNLQKLFRRGFNNFEEDQRERERDTSSPTFLGGNTPATLC